MAIQSGMGRGLWGVVFAVLVPVVLGAAVPPVSPERRLRVGPDGGYEGVTVSVAEGLGVEDHEELLDHLKALMRRTSDLIFEATEGRVFFAEVTILVPPSWNTTSGSDYVGKLDDAAIRIDEPNPFYGHLPYAQAAQPCGKSGEYVHLTPEAVTGRMRANETVGDVAKALVQAWARYRWGIFEEFGIPGDALYPHFREISTGRWEPTGCSSGYYGMLRTASGGKCRKGDEGKPEEECRFFPDERGLSQEACIMYEYNLKSAPTFCLEGTHDRLAPNKQNNLCDHRSSWAVMKEHEDFQTAFPNRSKQHDTLFHVARLSGDSPVNVLVVLDVARGDNPREFQKLWKYIRTELKSMVDSLPFGSAVGVATYEGRGEKYTFKELSRLSTVVSEANRESLKSTIDSIKGGKALGRETVRALEDSAGMVDRGGHAGVVLLVFTQLGRGSGDISETTQIRVLQERRVRVMGLSFLHPLSAPGLAEICTKTGGRWVTARKVTVREDIKDFMQFVASSKSLDNSLFLMETGVLQMGHKGSSKAIVFVEKGLGRLPSFSIESADGAMGTLLTPSGMEIDVTKDQACSHVRGQYRCTFDTAEPGNWTINITCLGSPCSSQTTVGFESYSYQRLASKDFESQQPITSFWISGSNSGVVDLSKEDFLVYARVQSGYAPVVGLDVTLTAESFNTSDKAYTTSLSDDGLDPDVTAGDGVYTGIIFPETPETFLLSLLIKGTGRTILLRGKDRWSPQTWNRGAAASGSNFNEVVSHGSEYVMQRTLVKFTTVKVTGVEGHKARPQRISDFKVLPQVEYSSDVAFVTMRWTSPKPRDGSNKVQRYLLYFSFDLSTILDVDRSSNASSLDTRDIFPDGGLAPLSAGEEQVVISRIRLKPNITTVYFRIQSVNRLETKSELSRVVPVHLKEIENSSVTNVLGEGELNSSRKNNQVRNGVFSSVEVKAKDLLFQAMAITANSSTGNNSSSPHRETPVIKRSWFIPVVATVCVLFALACAAAVVLLLRSRSRERQNSLKEAMLAWPCLKGNGGAFRKGDPEEDREGGQVQKTYGQAAWSCMSRGYPSTGNLGATVATVGRVEAEKWVRGMEGGGVDNGGFERQGEDRDGTPEDGGPEGPGPYKEVFIRHPDDVTTEL